jgi:hypothetical protein
MDTLIRSADLIRPEFGSTKTDRSPAIRADAVIVPIAPRQKAKRQAQPLQARIDRLTDKSAGPNGVWKWRGSLNPATGYPQISYTCQYSGKYTTKAVSRVVMELKLGRKLERHEYVLHDQGVPKEDVNPAHLRIGSQQDNMDDAKAEGRLRGKLDVAQIMKIDMLFHTKHVDKAALAHRFGVSTTTIHNIVVGKTHSGTTGRVYVPSKGGRKAKVSTVEKAKSRKRGAVN